MKKFEILSSFLLNRIKNIKIEEHTFMVIIGVVIGVLGGFGAIFFRFAIKFFQGIFFGSFHYSLEYANTLPWYIKLLAPAAGGLIVGPIVYYFAREAKGHGVPEVMEAVALRDGKIRPRVMIAKVIASAVCIGSGGSVGREGPIVQIGSALGSTIGQFLKITGAKLRTLVACGAAAGIAGTFNAPIAGALFSMEVILGDFGISQFSPIVVSSVSATVVSRHFLGNFPAFVIPKYQLVHVFEMIPYTILGILAGFSALFFINFLYKTEDIFEELKFPEPLKPVIGGFIIGILGIFIPHIFGVGYDSITLALHGKLVWYMLLFLIFLKIFATSITIGSGGSGGVFAPSLFIGAHLGGFIGIISHKLFPSITSTSGAYAIVGMGAVAAGAMHAPITAIVIIFELTNNYTIILPLMFSCIISVLITTHFKKDSIYTLKLSRRGINLFKGHEINILKSLKVSQAMKYNFEKIYLNTNIKKLMDLMVKSTHNIFFVINKENKLIGILSVDDLRKIIFDMDSLQPLIVAYDIMVPAKHIVTPEESLDIIMKIFSEVNYDELPVVNNLEEKKLIGVISKKDVIDLYNQEILKRDTATTLSRFISTTERYKEIHLVNNKYLSEFKIPDFFIDKKIKDLKIANVFNVEIILIKTFVNKNYSIITPFADYKFSKDDIITVIGEKEDIRKLKNFKNEEGWIWTYFLHKY